MASNIFRMFSPAKSQEDRTKKRKAQLRKAQLTYRERKERYTKALEDHVAETRSNEADLHLEIQRLQGTVQKLVRFIKDQRLQVPDELHLAVESCQIPDDLIVDGWANQQGQQSRDQDTDGALTATDWSPLTVPEESENVQITSHHSSLLRLGDLDLLAVGMEFVLILESPCLNHLYPGPDKVHEPGGHALTVSGKLAPYYPKSVFESHTAHQTFCREVPERSLQYLLALSPELCTASEITPVQAWNQIRCQPLFGGLEARKLWNLAEKLRDAATCHGFGAVVKQDFFEKVMFETLLVGRDF